MEVLFIKEEIKKEDDQEVTIPSDNIQRPAPTNAVQTPFKLEPGAQSSKSIQVKKELRTEDSTETSESGADTSTTSDASTNDTEHTFVEQMGYFEMAVALNDDINRRTRQSWNH